MAWFDEAGAVETPVYERPALPVGTVLAGPAIVTQLDATTVVPPGATVTVDAALSLLMEIGHE